MKKYLSFTVILAFVISSCIFHSGRHIKGNGNITTKNTPLYSFTELNVDGSVDVYLAQAADASAKIQADENLLPYIEVVQEGGKLTIKNKEGYNLESNDNMRIYVSAPSFNKINVSGAGNVVAENKIIAPQKLSLDISGAGDIKMEVEAASISTDISGVGSASLKGHTMDLELNISGTGNAKYYGLITDNATADISGVGNAEIFVNKTLHATISGTGSVHYKGDVTDVKQNVSGTGSVDKE